MSVSLTEIGKYLSYILRHHPEELNLEMDNQGWVHIPDLIYNSNRKTTYNLTYELLFEVVERDKKQRFAIKEIDGSLYIRANQGHSIKRLKMDYLPVEPPVILFHGTGLKYVSSIEQKGLLPKTRQYVHLSKSVEEAKSVGSRHGEIAVYKINAKQMYQDGFVFYCSENGVWLTDVVPFSYMERII